MIRDPAHIVARAFNTPLLMHPRKAEVIASVLAPRLTGVLPMVEVVPEKRGGASGPRGAGLDRLDAEPRGPVVTNAYGEQVTQERYLFCGGLALIAVEGSLVNRGAWIGASSGLTSYEGVTAQLAAASADPDVDTIVMSYDCPGGEAAGAFEMADAIRAAAAVKPVIALVNGMAASAAYAMASASTRIVTIPSGVSGSIGVVMLHLDYSKQLAEAGIRPTLIFSGDHKVDGNPFEALPAAVAAEFKAECDALRDMFVATVAKGRPGLTPAAIRATQARCFTGADAVAAGLADEVGTLDTIIAQHQTARAPGGSIKGPSSMTTIALADHERALASARTDAHAFGVQAGKSEGATALATAQQALATAKADGAKAERERVAGILGHAEADGRSSLARHLAFETDMAAGAAVKMLGASAKEAAPLAPAPSRMDRVPNPPVLPDGAGGEGPDAEAAWGAVMAKVNKEAERRF